MNNYDNKIITNNKGTTMIETIVSFVVLLIVIAGLTAMIRFSSNLRMRAVDTANVRAEFNKEIYKKNPNTSIVSEYSYIGKSAPDKKTMFYFVVSDETSAENLDTVNGDATTYDFKQNIKVPNIDATGYVGIDARIANENLVKPKVLMFRYHE